MFDLIIDKYESFPDSLISSVSYERSNENDGKVDIIISCMNGYNNDEFETIKLSFVGVFKFRFIENHPFSSLIINKALLINDKAGITFDFFPDIYKDGLKENLESDFIIKCTNVFFEVIDNE